MVNEDRNKAFKDRIQSNIHNIALFLCTKAYTTEICRAFWNTIDICMTNFLEFNLHHEAKEPSPFPLTPTPSHPFIHSYEDYISTQNHPVNLRSSSAGRRSHSRYKPHKTHISHAREANSDAQKVQQSRAGTWKSGAWALLGGGESR